MAEQDRIGPKICVYGSLRVELPNGEVRFADKSQIWIEIALSAFASGERAKIGEFSTVLVDATRRRIHNAGPLLDELGLDLKCSGISKDSRRMTSGVYVYFKERVRTDCDDVEETLATYRVKSRDVAAKTIDTFALGLCPELRQPRHPKWVSTKEQELKTQMQRLIDAISSGEIVEERTSDIPYKTRVAEHETTITAAHSNSKGINKPLSNTISAERTQKTNTLLKATGAIAVLAILIFVVAFRYAPASSSRLTSRPKRVEASRVTVPYGAQFTEISGFKTDKSTLNEVNPGEVVVCNIKVKNVGTQGWQRGFRPISLGVVNGYGPTDENRKKIGPIKVAWFDSDPVPWLKDGSGDRVFLRSNEIISTGQIKDFRFGLKMPTNPGPYSVTFQMVIDGPDITAAPSQDGWFQGPVLIASFLVRDRPLKS